MLLLKELLNLDKYTFVHRTWVEYEEKHNMLMTCSTRKEK